MPLLDIVLQVVRKHNEKNGKKDTCNPKVLFLVSVFENKHATVASREAGKSMQLRTFLL